MGRFRCFLLLFAVSVLCSANSFSGNPPLKRPKVAIVLCGGGAKGIAHIGALKRLEEIGIKPDMIVGTSMGALVGGMYSMGYSSAQLDTIVSNADWGYLLSDNTPREDKWFMGKQMEEMFILNIPFYDISRRGREDASFMKSLPAGVVSGNNVLNFLNGLAIGYQDSLDFNNLPIPFACMATDLSTGEEVRLDHGNLPLAMRASMAIPGFFSPVSIDGVVLVDGGVLNNFPVDVARKMGADIVIGIDVQSDLIKAESLTSIDAVLLQLIGLTGNNKYLQNVKDVDIYIKPDVSKFGTMSFSREAVDTLLANGYAAAVSQSESLLGLKKKLQGYDSDALHDDSPASPKNIFMSEFLVRKIECDGIDDTDRRWLLKMADLREGSVISGERINKALSVFYGTKAFSSVTYSIVNQEDGSSKLVFRFRKGPTNMFSVGVRYDSEEAAAVLLHVGIHQNSLHGSRESLTARLSYNPYVRIGYSYVFQKQPRLDIAYEFNKKDVNIYSSKAAGNNIQYIYNGLELAFANIRYLRTFDVKMGMRIENYKFTRFLTDIEEMRGNGLKARSYFSVFAKALMDTRDDRYFSKSGVYFDVEGDYYLKGFHSGFRKYGDLRLDFSATANLGGKFALIPQFYTRSAFRNKGELVGYNYVGGSVSGRYIRHQIPFIGINYAYTFENSVAVLRSDLRKQFGENHYVYAMVNYMREGSSQDKVLSFKKKGYWGLGAQYSYKSKIGPLSFNLHWSDYNPKKVGAYVSLGVYF